MANGEPKVTVIIPAYNTEKYLVDCLQSVTAQTMKELEIIIINDCSPDDSHAVIEQFKKKDGRIQYIRHNTNKGHGGAINSALKIARGEYTWQIDSDDFVDTRACEFLYNYAKSRDLDALGLCANNFIRKNGYKLLCESHKYLYPKNMLEKLYTGRKFLEHCYIKNNFIITPPWGYLFRTNLLKRIPFRENVSYEDTDGIPLLLHACIERISCVKYAPYFRLIHEENSMHALENDFINFSEKQMVQRFGILEALLNYIEKNKLPDKDSLAYFAFSFYHKKTVKEFFIFEKQNGRNERLSAEYDNLSRRIKDKFGTVDFRKYRKRYGVLPDHHEWQEFSALPKKKRFKMIVKYFLNRY